MEGKKHGKGQAGVIKGRQDSPDETGSAGQGQWYIAGGKGTLGRRDRLKLKGDRRERAGT
jgi:hypothetical protein